MRINFEQFAEDYIDLDRLLPAHKKALGPEEFRAKLSDGAKTSIVKTHATPAYEEFAQDQPSLSLVKQIRSESKVVYVFRDGRDVMASLYHYEKSMVPSSPEKSFSEFLRSPNPFFNPPGAYATCGWPSGLTTAQVWARHVNEWMDCSGCFGVSYEEWSTDPDTTLRKVADFLGLPVPPSVRRVAFQKLSLVARVKRRITGKQLASSAVKPRKGIVGDWVNHFSKEDEALFWEIAGSSMRRLGYSQSVARAIERSAVACTA